MKQSVLVIGLGRFGMAAARELKREESETIAQGRGASAVEDADVIRGWIAVTPPDQRNSLVAIIESLGYEPIAFADDLESVDGWDDGESL